MIPVNYKLSKEEFAKILRTFRAYSRPVSPAMDQMGIAFLVKSWPDMVFYHIFYMTHDDCAFVAEYMYKFEQLTLIEGNIKGFKHLFPDVAITEEK